MTAHAPYIHPHYASRQLPCCLCCKACHRNQMLPLAAPPMADGLSSGGIMLARAYGVLPHLQVGIEAAKVACHSKARKVEPSFTNALEKLFAGLVCRQSPLSFRCALVVPPNICKCVAAKQSCSLGGHSFYASGGT